MPMFLGFFFFFFFWGGGGGGGINLVRQGQIEFQSVPNFELVHAPPIEVRISKF